VRLATVRVPRAELVTARIESPGETAGRVVKELAR
jgi:hypothetical protein